MINKAKYAILDIAMDLKVVASPSRYACLKHHNFITLKIFLTTVQQFIPS